MSKNSKQEEIDKLKKIFSSFTDKELKKILNNPDNKKKLKPISLKIIHLKFSGQHIKDALFCLDRATNMDIIERKKCQDHLMQASDYIYDVLNRL